MLKNFGTQFLVDNKADYMAVSSTFWKIVVVPIPIIGGTLAMPSHCILEHGTQLDMWGDIMKTKEAGAPAGAQG